MPPPSVIAHADWSMHANKRWMAVARRERSGRWQASGVEVVGDLNTLTDRLADAAICDGPTFMGFDFPIGLPVLYAKAAGIADFRASLAGFGLGEWEEFYSPAYKIHEVAIHRPFFPAGLVKKNEVKRDDLARALGLETYRDLLRECELKTPTRDEASSLFFTLGGKQVGKAAIAGWEQLLAPLLSRRADVGLWPFDGTLGEIFAASKIVLAETYPGEFYSHLGVDPKRRVAGATAGGKRIQGSRRLNADALLNAAESLSVDFSSAAVAQIRDGFGGDATGEDRFDAVVGLLGMINVADGHRGEGQHPDPGHQEVEGWILGQTSPKEAPFPLVASAGEAEPSRAQPSKAQEPCVFCEPPQDRLIFKTDKIHAIWDKYPVSPGHVLIAPLAHRADWLDATRAEHAALTAAIDEALTAIRTKHGHFDGFNIGVNSGRAAGQTVPHLHLHVIPRTAGDVDDPRGGVRHVIPGKAKYWDNE